MNYFKPVFKKILRLKKSLFYHYKVLKFKKKKWRDFVAIFKRENMNNKLNKYKFIDQNKLLIYMHSNYRSNYQTEYKRYFFSIKVLSTFYFNCLKKKLKLLRQKSRNYIFNFFENCIDFVLLRSKFGLTIRFVRKLLYTKVIFVNHTIIRNKLFRLCSSDFINFNFYCKKYENNLIHCKKWPLPANNLLINYKTKKIIFLGYLKPVIFFILFPQHLKLMDIFF